jgi:fatty-acyl-CoA synthase
MLITMARFRDLDYVATLDAIAPGWEDDVAASFPDMLQVVVHGETDRRAKTYESLIAEGEAAEAELPQHDAKPQDTALIMYTSGTTGLPKGVIQTHDGLLRISFVEAYHMGYHDGQRTLFALPLYHAFGMVVGVLSAIWVGGAIIPQLVFDPVQTFRDIERHKATFALFVPTMVMALIEHPDRDKYDLSSLTGVLSGAAPTPVRAWKQLIDMFGLEEVFTGYGMTEHSCATVMTRAGDPLELVEGTVGRPMDAGPAGIAGGAVGEFRTVEPYTLEFLPEGEEGELVFRGPTATPGYFRDPKLTAELLMDDGWVRSGDLGRIRPDGYIELTGRSKELYKTGGELVAPREVEDVLDQHPDVAQSFVIGIPDERWGEIGGAFVVPASGKTPDPEELQAWCRERLAKYKWPRHVFFAAADDLPKTPTGKVQKFQLVKRAQALLEESGANAAE